MNSDFVFGVLSGATLTVTVVTLYRTFDDPFKSIWNRWTNRHEPQQLSLPLDQIIFPDECCSGSGWRGIREDSSDSLESQNVVITLAPTVIPVPTSPVVPTETRLSNTTVITTKLDWECNNDEVPLTSTTKLPVKKKTTNKSTRPRTITKSRVTPSRTSTYRSKKVKSTKKTSPTTRASRRRIGRKSVSR